MTFHPGALQTVSRALSEAIRPRPPLPFRQWLPQNIVLVDGPKKGEFWSETDAPYLGPIAEVLDVEHPANLVTVRKSQQTGVSIFALAWALYLAEIAPDNILYGVPGIDALQDVNSQKLQPMIDEWQKTTRKRVILPAVSRSGAGSTIYEKRFAGGSVMLANANSVMDLSSKTTRYGVKDEVSKWANTPNGDDPEVLFFGRFTAYRRLKLWKILELSTPENDSGDPLGDAPGHCRVDRSFQRSDQRYWHVACPECGHVFVQSHDGFAIDRAHPHRSHYECPKCEHHISEMERVAAVRAGEFIATADGEGRHPGFHVDAFVSLMMSYEAIAEEWLDREKQGEEGMKGFTNLVLGLPYQLKGDAPEWERLFERREDYPEGVVPPDGLIFTGGADVQHDGIYAEAVAFGQDRQTWSVFNVFLEGDTDNPQTGAWTKLDEIYRREFPDSFGGTRRLDAMGVDSGDGNRSTQVLVWCAQRPNCYATKGVDGRAIPAIGTPTKRMPNKLGKVRRVRGARSWPIGTWGLKSEFYGHLRLVGRASGQDFDPPGYCHFGQWQDKEFFRQLTAEYFDQKMIKGRIKEAWIPIRRDNHYLDCRVIAMSMAELLNLSKLTSDGWAALRARLIPSQPVDLLSPVSATVTKPANLPDSPKPSSKSLAELSKGWKR